MNQQKSWIGLWLAMVIFCTFVACDDLQEKEKPEYLLNFDRSKNQDIELYVYTQEQLEKYRDDYNNYFESLSTASALGFPSLPELHGHFLLRENYVLLPYLLDCFRIPNRSNPKLRYVYEINGKAREAWSPLSEPAKLIRLEALAPLGVLVEISSVSDLVRNNLSRWATPGSSDKMQLQCEGTEGTNIFPQFSIQLQDIGKTVFSENIPAQFVSEVKLYWGKTIIQGQRQLNTDVFKFSKEFKMDLLLMIDSVMANPGKLETIKRGTIEIIQKLVEEGTSARTASQQIRWNSYGVVFFSGFGEQINEPNLKEKPRPEVVKICNLIQTRVRREGDDKVIEYYRNARKYFPNPDASLRFLVLITDGTTEPFDDQMRSSLIQQGIVPMIIQVDVGSPELKTLAAIDNFYHKIDMSLSGDHLRNSLKRVFEEWQKSVLP